MNFLFVMRHSGYVRNFESTLRMLGDRGHAVELAFQTGTHWLLDAGDVAGQLCARYPRFSRSTLPDRIDGWGAAAQELRATLDYLRYLEPRYRDAPRLRSRATRYVPAAIIERTDRGVFGTPAGRAVLTGALRALYRAIPCDPRIDAFLAARRPDVLALTQLIQPDSPQAEYVRSARALGIRTAFCVASWDNLTNKGVIHGDVDLVTVWNEMMKREAVDLHRVPADRVVVTGAQAFDHWFDWRPSTDRRSFCERIGLPPDRPYLLYLCSSKFIAPDETAFVREWVQRLRGSSSPALRSVGVLVRPHPQHADQWRTAEMKDLGAVVVWPRAGAAPSDDENRAAYFDSIHYSAAVVGINTTAEIESAIVGRPVYSVLMPEFKETQEGTLHFSHLRDVNGGLLHLARTFPEHLEQLDGALRGSDTDDGRCRRFVEAFIRPFGLDVPGTPRLVEALEGLGHAPSRRRAGAPAWAPLVQPWVARRGERLLREGTRAKRAERKRHGQERAERLQMRANAKRQAAEARELRKREAQARRDEARAVEQRTAARAYEAYLEVRECARRMRDACPPGSLTLVERQAVDAIAHLWEATPEVIGRLRRHCAPLTGVRASDYDAISAELKGRLARERGLLRRQAPPELCINEPAVLGGFGVTKDDVRYNEDTLRYSKALVALHDAAVLGAFRNDGPRHVVWEIGGGWGGFAYQFKTLCPHVTYVITGMPDAFLVSAVYLMATFPDARVRFASPDTPVAELWRDWESLDFVFVPEAALPALQPPRLDLVLDVMALRNMPPERVDVHVQRAYELGARYFYSLLPADGGGQHAPVWAPIEQRYWPHPVPPRVEKMPPVVDLTGGPPLESDSAHLVGWRRLSA